MNQNLSVFVNFLKLPACSREVSKLRQLIQQLEAHKKSKLDLAQYLDKSLKKLEIEFLQNEEFLEEVKKSKIEDSNEQFVGEGLEKFLYVKIFSEVERVCEETGVDERLQKLCSSLQERRVQLRDFGSKLYLNPQSTDLITEELRKMEMYKSPRAKLVCVLNSLKCLSQILHQSNLDSTDELLPAVIYCTVLANPKKLKTTVEYVINFRSPRRLVGEDEFLMTVFTSAVSYLETYRPSFLEEKRVFREDLDSLSFTFRERDFASLTEDELRDLFSEYKEMCRLLIDKDDPRLYNENLVEKNEGENFEKKNFYEEENLVEKNEDENFEKKNFYEEENLVEKNEDENFEKKSFYEEEVFGEEKGVKNKESDLKEDIFGNLKDDTLNSPFEEQKDSLSDIFNFGT